MKRIAQSETLRDIRRLTRGELISSRKRTRNGERASSVLDFPSTLLVPRNLDRQVFPCRKLIIKCVKASQMWQFATSAGYKLTLTRNDKVHVVSERENVHHSTARITTNVLTSSPSCCDHSFFFFFLVPSHCWVLITHQASRSLGGRAAVFCLMHCTSHREPSSTPSPVRAQTGITRQSRLPICWADEANTGFTSRTPMQSGLWKKKKKKKKRIQIGNEQHQTPDVRCIFPLQHNLNQYNLIWPDLT